VFVARKKKVFEYHILQHHLDQESKSGSNIPHWQCDDVDVNIRQVL